MRQRWMVLAATAFLVGCPIPRSNNGVGGPNDRAGTGGGAPQEPMRPTSSSSSKLLELFGDDFEGDASPFFELDGFRRVEGVGVEGSRGLTVTIAPGQESAGSAKLGVGAVPDSYLSGIGDSSTAYHDLEYEFDVRIEGARGVPHKLVRSAVLARSDWSEAAVAHAWGSPNLPSLRGDPATAVVGNTVAASGYNDFEAFRWLGQMPAGVVADGAWHRVRIRQALNTLGRADGLFEIEVDGQIARRTDLDWRGQYAGYGWNVVFLEAFYNGGAPNAIQITFDNLVVRGEGEPFVDPGPLPMPPEPQPRSTRPEPAAPPADPPPATSATDPTSSANSPGSSSSATDANGSAAWYAQDWTSLDGIENSTTGGGEISLITDAGGPGFDRALRVTFFPNAGGEAQAGVTISFPDGPRDRPTELWLEYYARWSPNWTVDGPYAGTAGHKHLFLFDQEQTGAGRWEQFIGNNGSSMNLIAGDFGPGGGHASFPGGIRSLWDGRWKLMRCHARMSARDGTWECWVDGKYFTWGRGNTQRQPGLWFQYLALSRNTNRGTDRLMTLDFGPVSVYTRDPGW